MKPVTRQEIFENAVAEGKTPNIKPLTREEIVLAKHARREASGGGSGGGGAGDLIVDSEIFDDSNDAFVEYAKKLIYPTVIKRTSADMEGTCPKVYLQKYFAYNAYVDYENQENGWLEAWYISGDANDINNLIVSVSIVITAEQVLEIKAAWEKLGGVN